MLKKFCCIGLIILVSCSERGTALKEEKAQPFFKSLSSNLTEIEFSNNIKHNVATNENLLDFDYFYNGAGVGVFDVNNDGLQDIFFCGNQVDNKIYLNKGGLKFEDVSENSGINSSKNWANGVTFVDFNNDGWQDIYISQGGPYDADRRGNVVLINNKDLTFSDQTEQYKLGDQGISTQSSFFDFDKDGDMDCFVMNESILYGYDPQTFHRLLLENPTRSYVSYSHLYRNDGGVFTDVTREAGISAPTFGLGLAVSDINNDGWLDIYIANDYYQPDNLYINRKNGTFSDRIKNHLNQTSFFGMGVDIADINNDGLQDLFILDMASKDHVRSKTLMASMDTENFDLLVNQFNFIYQYMFNSLQINNGRNSFNNVAHMAGVAKTDWSWAAIIEDLDHDGLKDIYVTNGYRKYGTDNDFKQKVIAEKNRYNNQVPLEVKEKLYDEIPSERLENIFFSQAEHLKFKDKTSAWSDAAPTFSNGAATADLDNDGDLDIIVSNIDDKAHILENQLNSSNNYVNIYLPDDKHQYASVTVSISDQIQSFEVRKVRGYMSSVQPMVHIGLSDVDVIERIEITSASGELYELERVSANQTLTIKDFKQGKSNASNNLLQRKINPASPLSVGLDYVHKENDFNDFKEEILLPYKQSTLGPCLAAQDINGDAVVDFYLGGAKGQAGKLYISSGDRYQLSEGHDFIMDVLSDDIDAVFIDIDNDNDQDLFVMSGGNEEEGGATIYRDRLYIQTDEGYFKKQEIDHLKASAYSGGKAATIDFNRDGFMDLVIGNRIKGQRYPLSAPSYILMNNNGSLEDVTKKVFPDLSDYGIINDIEVADFDGDGWDDLVIAGEWAAPKLYRNKEGSFEEVGQEIFPKGLWFSINKTDFDNDGDVDLLFGNIGENYKLKATESAPLKVYAGDLDNTGSHDLVLSQNYKGAYVPVRGKECSSEQLPFIDEKFNTYEDYAASSLIDIYGEDNLEESYAREITSTSHAFFINNGNFEFEEVKLPQEVQAFPILDGESLDVNDDGFDDLIVLGTLYNTEVETPRLDAGGGLVLINDKGSRYIINNREYNIYTKGNVREVYSFKGSDQKSKILILRNDGDLALYTH